MINNSKLTSFGLMSILKKLWARRSYKIYNMLHLNGEPPETGSDMFLSDHGPLVNNWIFYWHINELKFFFKIIIHSMVFKHFICACDYLHLSLVCQNHFTQSFLISWRFHILRETLQIWATEYLSFFSRKNVCGRSWMNVSTKQPKLNMLIHLFVCHYFCSLFFLLYNPHSYCFI